MGRGQVRYENKFYHPHELPASHAKYKALGAPIDAGPPEDEEGRLAREVADLEEAAKKRAAEPSTEESAKRARIEALQARRDALTAAAPPAPAGPTTAETLQQENARLQATLALTQRELGTCGMEEGATGSKSTDNVVVDLSKPPTTFGGISISLCTQVHTPDGIAYWVVQKSLQDHFKNRDAQTFIRRVVSPERADLFFSIPNQTERYDHMFGRVRDALEATERLERALGAAVAVPRWIARAVGQQVEVHKIIWLVQRVLRAIIKALADSEGVPAWGDQSAIPMWVNSALGGPHVVDGPYLQSTLRQDWSFQLDQVYKASLQSKTRTGVVFSPVGAPLVIPSAGGGGQPPSNLFPGSGGGGGGGAQPKPACWSHMSGPAFLKLPNAKGCANTACPRDHTLPTTKAALEAACPQHVAQFKTSAAIIAIAAKGSQEPACIPKQAGGTGGEGQLGGGAQGFAPVFFEDPPEHEALLEEARERYGKTAGRAGALAWASDMDGWPADVRERDAARLKKAGTIENLVRSLQDTTRGARINTQRITAVVALVPELADDDEFQELTRLLLEMAEEGMKVRTPAAFVPNGEPPAMGASEEEMQPAICKLLLKPYSKGYILLLPEEEVREEQRRSGRTANFIGTGWAESANKVEGRITINPSHTKPLTASLNLPRDETHRIGAEQYGVHPYPTLRDLIRMILAAEILYDGDVFLLKLDMQGAFHLLDFSPESVRLMCSRVRGGMVLLWLVGNFGHVHTPYAFGVLSRFLEMVVNQLGLREGCLFNLKIYVDDLMAAVKGAHVQRARETLEGVMRLLLGDNSVATDKTEWGKALTLIGWDTDLVARNVTMSRKTLLKALYLFSLVSPAGTVAYEHLEVLAALTERFSAVAPELAGFRSYLYGAYSWMNRFSTVTLDDTALTALRLVKSLVVRHLSLAGARYSFDFFAPRRATWVVEYDGSIHGIGGRVFELVDGVEHLRLCISLDLPESIAAHPDRELIQNGCELLAASVSVAAILSLGVRDVGLHLRGDSVVSGSWLSAGRYKSPFSKNSSLLWLTFGQSCGLSMEEWTHLPKERNTVCDAYSRRTRPTSHGCPPHVIEALDSLVALCNPVASRAHFESLPTLNGFLADLSVSLSALVPSL